MRHALVLAALAAACGSDTAQPPPPCVGVCPPDAGPPQASLVAVPNPDFNAIAFGVPEGWASACRWGQFIYADAYGEERSGALLFTFPGCAARSEAVSGADVAPVVRLRVRYMVESAIEEPCTTCLQAAIEWLPGGEVSAVTGAATGGAWRTLDAVSVRPAGATSYSVTLTGRGTTGDSVYVDTVAFPE